MLVPIAAIAQTQEAQSAVTAIGGVDERVTSIQPLKGDTEDDTSNKHSSPGASSWGPSRNSSAASVHDEDPSRESTASDTKLREHAQSGETAAPSTSDKFAEDADSGSLSKARPVETRDGTNSAKKPAEASVTSIELVAVKPDDSGKQSGKSGLHNPFSGTKAIPAFAGSSHSELYRTARPVSAAKQAKAKSKKQFGKSSAPLPSGISSANSLPASKGSYTSKLQQ